MAHIVSIHAPRVGGDKHCFQFPSLWKCGFNPRPPRGGRRSFHISPAASNEVSIHAPRVGGDARCARGNRRGRCFNPRPPRGGRHQTLSLSRRHNRFNPRPPRGGRPRTYCNRSRAPRFNPRPPRGGRPATRCLMNSRITFQSTPPAWGATELIRQQLNRERVSIHAPRVGGDRFLPSKVRNLRRFNPRPPRGGRR